MTLEIQNRNLEAQEAVVQDLAAMLCPARTCSGAPVDHWVQLLCQHCQSHPCPLSPSGTSGATHQVTGIGVGTAGTDRVTAHWQWGWGLPEGFQCPLPSPWPSHLTSQSFVGGHLLRCHFSLWQQSCSLGISLCHLAVIASFSRPPELLQHALKSSGTTL